MSLMTHEHMMCLAKLDADCEASSLSSDPVMVHDTYKSGVSVGATSRRKLHPG